MTTRFLQTVLRGALLLVVSATAWRCAATHMPISQELASTTEAMALRAIGALAFRDQSALTSLGLPAAAASDALDDVAGMPDLDADQARFELDHIVATSYFRQYSVPFKAPRPGDPGPVQIRVWFAEDTRRRPCITSLQFPAGDR